MFELITVKPSTPNPSFGFYLLTNDNGLNILVYLFNYN